MSETNVPRQLARLVRPILQQLLKVFFDSKYLTGRYFDQSLGGYIWGFRAVWSRNILRLGKPLPWPVALGVTVMNPCNIEFHPDDLNNFQSPGTYFQNQDAKIIIGKGSYIAPNVGLITSNHRLSALDQHEPGRDIVIGERSWIGMNAVILPGVFLGAGTIVAAGAVVTKSFPQGGLVVGGVPARILREVEVSGSQENVGDV